MMEKDVQKWLNKNFSKMIKKYQVDKWKFFIRYEENEDVGFIRKASVAINARYEQAIIIIYPDCILDTRDLERAIRHELLHVVLAPYEIYSDKVMASVSRNLKHCLKEADSIASEQAVLNLERLLDAFS